MTSTDRRIAGTSHVTARRADENTLGTAVAVAAMVLGIIGLAIALLGYDQASEGHAPSVSVEANP